MAVTCELQQEPAEQKADRRAADVTEKEPCDRPVEGRKAEDRVKECGRDQRG
jgi:hypothetical protein